MKIFLIAAFALLALANAQDDGRYYPSDEGRYNPDDSGRYNGDDSGAYRADGGSRPSSGNRGGNGNRPGGSAQRPRPAPVTRPNGAGSGAGFNGNGGGGRPADFSGSLTGFVPPPTNGFGNGGASNGGANGFGGGASGNGGRPSSGAGGRSGDGAATIIKDEKEITEEGYHYIYETSNGLTGEEAGKLENVGSENEGIKAGGFYEYTGDDNVLYRVDYTADDNGFQPIGSHLPLAPPIPEEIQRSLDYLRSIGQL